MASQLCIIKDDGQMWQLWQVSHSNRFLLMSVWLHLLLLWHSVQVTQHVYCNQVSISICRFASPVRFVGVLFFLLAVYGCTFLSTFNSPQRSKITTFSVVFLSFCWWFMESLNIDFVFFLLIYIFSLKFSWLWILNP